MRPDGTTREKWRILDEKVGERYGVIFRAPKVVARLVSIMYWCIRDLWGPANLIASTVTELDDTPPHP
jgi:hypothetical protein